MTDGANFLALDFEASDPAANGCPEIDVDLVFEVGAGLRALGGWRSLENMPEKMSRKLPQPGLRRLHRRRLFREIESAEVEGDAFLLCTASACCRTAGPGCGFSGGGIDLIGIEAELVVDFAFLLVAQDVVGFGDFLELLFGLFVAGIDVGMVFTRELAKRFADLVRGRGLFDAEGRVIVFVLGWWHFFFESGGGRCFQFSGFWIAGRGTDFAANAREMTICGHG